MKQRRLHIGVSGRSSPGWVCRFYPTEMRPQDFLRLSSLNFGAVEVDSSYPGTPTAKLAGAWKAVTPVGFRFCPRTSQVITREKRLQN